MKFSGPLCASVPLWFNLFRGSISSGGGVVTKHKVYLAWF